MEKEQKFVEKIQSIYNLSTDEASARYKLLRTMKEKFQKSSNESILLDMFSIIGNKDKFELLWHLRDNSKSISDLIELVGKSQSTLSHHLKILEDNGYINSRKEGKYTYYSINKKKITDLDQTFSIWAGQFSKWFD